MARYKLEDHIKRATSTNGIAGVYWSARDLGSSPLGNHHFFTFVYENEEQALRVSKKWGVWDIRVFSELNEVGHRIYFTTMGVDKDGGGDIFFEFSPPTDVMSIYEICKDDNTSLLTADSDYESCKLDPARSSQNISTNEQLMLMIVEMAFKFNTNEEAGLGVPYVLEDENCAAGVNSILKYLGFPKDYRISVGEFDGIDWGEEQTYGEQYFSMTYVGNKRSKELHVPMCEYVAAMADSNKLNFESMYDAVAEGYNGCYHCFNCIDTDSRPPVKSIYRLHLISLSCSDTEDWTGADETYLRVKGIKVWGPKSMNDGEG